MVVKGADSSTNAIIVFILSVISRIVMICLPIPISLLSFAQYYYTKYPLCFISVHLPSLILVPFLTSVYEIPFLFGITLYSLQTAIPSGASP